MEAPSLLLGGWGAFPGFSRTAGATSRERHRRADAVAACGPHSAWAAGCGGGRQGRLPRGWEPSGASGARPQQAVTAWAKQSAPFFLSWHEIPMRGREPPLGPVLWDALRAWHGRGAEGGEGWAGAAEGLGHSSPSPSRRAARGSRWADPGGVLPWRGAVLRADPVLGTWLPGRPLSTAPHLLQPEHRSGRRWTATRAAATSSAASWVGRRGLWDVQSVLSLR